MKLVREAKVWLFLVALSLSMIIFLHALYGRLGLGLGFLFAIAIHLITFFYEYHSLFLYLQAKPIEGRDPYGCLNFVKKYCQSGELPEPRVFVFPSDRINALTATCGLNDSAILISEAALTKLSSEELEALIALSLGQLSLKSGFRSVLFDRLTQGFSYLALIFVSIGRTLLPLKILKYPFFPLIWLCKKLSLLKRDFLEADQVALKLHPQPENLARLLWRIYHEQLSQTLKLPLGTEHHLVVESLLEKDPFRSQPRVEERILALVKYYPI